MVRHDGCVSLSFHFLVWLSTLTDSLTSSPHWLAPANAHVLRLTAPVHPSIHPFRPSSTQNIDARLPWSRPVPFSVCLSACLSSRSRVSTLADRTPTVRAATKMTARNAVLMRSGRVDTRGRRRQVWYPSLLSVCLPACHMIQSVGRSLTHPSWMGRGDGLTDGWMDWRGIWWS